MGSGTAITVKDSLPLNNPPLLERNRKKENGMEWNGIEGVTTKGYKKV